MPGGLKTELLIVIGAMLFSVIYRFFKKFDMLLPSMKETYFCKISFISPAR